jgi:hypothetical protein
MEYTYKFNPAQYEVLKIPLKQIAFPHIEVRRLEEFYQELCDAR